jgi:hypothetical protein
LAHVASRPFLLAPAACFTPARAATAAEKGCITRWGAAYTQIEWFLHQRAEINHPKTCIPNDIEDAQGNVTVDTVEDCVHCPSPSPPSTLIQLSISSDIWSEGQVALLGVLGGAVQVDSIKTSVESAYGFNA